MDNCGAGFQPAVSPMQAGSPHHKSYRIHSAGLLRILEVKNAKLL